VGKEPGEALQRTRSQLTTLDKGVVHLRTGSKGEKKHPNMEKKGFELRNNRTCSKRRGGIRAKETPKPKVSIHRAEGRTTGEGRSNGPRDKTIHIPERG